jgi:hypothetical protein
LLSAVKYFPFIFRVIFSSVFLIHLSVWPATSIEKISGRRAAANAAARIRAIDHVRP